LQIYADNVLFHSKSYSKAARSSDKIYSSAPVQAQRLNSATANLEMIAKTFATEIINIKPHE
jgi:hypothetical protein